jgi:phage terminase small subunit
MANHPHDKTRPAKKSTLQAIERGDFDALRLSLTIRQRRFCDEYVIDYDGSAAAIRAGYAPKGAPQQAHTLMMNSGVQAYIDYLTQSKEAKITAVSPDYVVAKVVDTLDKADKKGNFTAVLRACELLAKHLGMFVERTELTGKDGGPLEVNQKRIEEDAVAFTNLLNQLKERAASVKEPVKTR